MRICALEESLDLHLVADLALIEADHMAFVEDKKAYIIEKRRIVSQRKVKFFGCGNNDIALADCILVETTHADTAIEGGDSFPEGPECSLKRRFGLGGQRPQRGYEDDTLASSKAT